MSNATSLDEQVGEARQIKENNGEIIINFVKLSDYANATC